MFKPTQGKNARLWTAVGLGALVGVGIFRVYELYLKDQYPPVPRYGIPAALGPGLRLVHLADWCSTRRSPTS